MKTYFKATLIKTECLKYRQIDQRNKVKIPDPEIHSHFIFNKRAIAMQWEKDGLFNKQYPRSIGYTSKENLTSTSHYTQKSISAGSQS